MWLGISTATGHLGLALVSDEGLVAEVTTAVGLEHSEAMFHSLEAVFALSGVKKSQLKGLGVAVGPGGFTGVRSGVSLGKATAMALGLPAHGVGTLPALAWPHVGPGRVVASLLDGRRGLVFLGAFGPEGQALGEEGLWPLAEAIAKLKDLGPGLVLVGEGAQAHREALQAALPLAHFPPEEGMALRPSSVAAIARLAHAAGQLPGPEALTPRYLREPKAVVEWEAAQVRQGQGP